MGGGGGKGGGGAKVIQLPPQTITSSSTTTPWAPQQPYLTKGFEAVKNALLDTAPKVYTGQTVAGFAPETQQAFNAITNRANAGSPVMDAANKSLTSTLNGDFLYGGDGFNAALKAAVNNILPQINGSFQQAGRFNSGLSKVAQAKAIGDAFAGLYDNERQRQMATQSLAPSYAASDYNDAAMLQSVGEARQTQAQKEMDAAQQQFYYPQQALQDQVLKYLAAVSGNYGSSTSGTQTTTGLSQVVQQPYTGNPITNALGGIATGAGLAAGFGINPLFGLAGGAAGFF